MPNRESFEVIFQQLKAECRSPLCLQGVGDCTDWELKGELDGMHIHARFGLDVDITTKPGVIVFTMSGEGQGWGWPFTIVAGDLHAMSNLSPRREYAAPIKCILYGVALNCDELMVVRQGIESVMVATPVIARIEPSVTIIGEQKDWFDELISGREFSVKGEHASTLRHEGWSCGYAATVGSGGISFDNMQAVLPVERYGNEDDDLLSLAKTRVDAWRTLLTLLAGGGRDAPVVGAALRLRDGLDLPDCSFFAALDDSGASRHKFVPVLFPLRAFHCLDRLPHGFYRHALTRLNALDRIGMDGVARWCEWYADFWNQSVIKHWLHTDEFLGAFPVLEGIGRRLRRAEQPQGTVYFKGAVDAVLRKVWDAQPITEPVVVALNETNNKLAKHIGDIGPAEDGEWRLWAPMASRFTSLLVGYAALKIGTETLDRELEARWQEVIGRAYVEVSNQSNWPNSVVRAVEKEMGEKWFRFLEKEANRAHACEDALHRGGLPDCYGRNADGD